MQNQTQIPQGGAPTPVRSQPSPQGRPGQPPGSPIASTSGKRSELDALLEDEQFQEFYADLTDYLPTVRDTRDARARLCAVVCRNG